MYVTEGSHRSQRLSARRYGNERSSASSQNQTHYDGEAKARQSVGNAGSAQGTRRPRASLRTEKKFYPPANGWGVQKISGPRAVFSRLWISR